MRTLLLSLLVAAPVALSAISPGPQDDDAKKPAPPGVGDNVPALRLDDHEGKAVQLPAKEAEGFTVLAFFPKAATPG